MAETKEGERVRPFSCGSQYADWADKNCNCCVKGVDWDAPVPDSRCDIERALSLANIRDGTVGADTARRMALPVLAAGEAPPYGWRCGEWEERHDG